MQLQLPGDKVKSQPAEDGSHSALVEGDSDRSGHCIGSVWIVPLGVERSQN
jgi:hypothetical protein